jgi:hypothetical protein
MILSSTSKSHFFFGRDVFLYPPTQTVVLTGIGSIETFGTTVVLVSAVIHTLDILRPRVSSNLMNARGMFLE